MSDKPKMFREEALRRLSSPDELDQLLKIIRPQHWVVVTAVAAGLVVGLLWALFGRIPLTSNGTAILVRPKQVVPLQVPSDGPIVSIEVAVGDHVGVGDLLARLSLPALEKQLENEQSRLAQFRARSRELSVLERDLAESEREHIVRQRTMIEERIVAVEETSAEHMQRNEAYILEQRKNIATARSLSLELGESLDDQLAAYEKLKEEGIVSREPVVSAQSRTVDNRVGLADLEVREQELALQENQGLESYNRDQDLIRDLRIRLSDLELKEMEIERRLRQTELDDATTEEEIVRNIEELSTRIRSDGHVFSEYDGRVLEITASVGEMARRGQRIGKIEIEAPDSELMALAYFQIRDGKKIEPDHRIRVSPSTVERERFGGIVGRVVEVTDYPITTDAAANQIGDLEIARTLLNGTSCIGVTAQLELDETPSGFLWTSGLGPEQSITPGTTADVRVTTDERAPITFVLPFLKSLVGV